MKKILAASLVLSMVLLNGFYAATTSPSAKHAQKTKGQIAGDLRRQIRDIVQDEIRAGVRAQVVDEVLEDQRTRRRWAAAEAEQSLDMEQLVEAANRSLNGPESEMQAGAVETLLKPAHIRELVNSELAAYRAGAYEADAPVGGGVSKRSNPSSGSSSGLSEQSSMQEIAGPAQMERQSRQKEQAVERTLIQEGGLLLPRGKLQIEPSFTTAHFSSNRINIEGFSILPVLVIGEISTEAVKRDIMIGATALRYGLWRNLQGEVKVPYRYEFDRITSNLGDERTSKVSGLGDVEGTLSSQIFREHGWIPDMLASVSFKSRTGDDPYTNPIGLGTGFYGVRTSLVAVKTSDPAVVFGTINYTWNLARQFPLLGEIDPGNSVGFGLGTAIALSYQTAINFQFEQSITPKMKRDNIPINGSFLNSASLKVGFNWTVSERMAIDFGISKGLTTDAPDYAIELRVPYTF